MPKNAYAHVAVMEAFYSNVNAPDGANARVFCVAKFDVKCIASYVSDYAIMAAMPAPFSHSKPCSCKSAA